MNVCEDGLMGMRNLLKNLRRGSAIAAPATSETKNAREADDLLQLGAAQRELAQFSLAVGNLERAIALRYDFGAAYHVLGLVYRDQGNLDDAIDSLELATHFSPENVEAHLDLGTSLSRLGRYDAAERAIRQAINLAPDHAASWLCWGNLCKTRGALEQAGDHYCTAIRLDATLSAAHLQYAFLLFKVGHYEESSIAHLNALNAFPDMAELHHNFGLLLLETGFPEEALARFDRALVLQPDSIATRTCIAHALRDLGRLEEALAVYDNVLAKQPQFGDAIANRSYTLLMCEKYSAGWKQYEQRFAATDTPLRKFPFATWQGESLTGKRILVFAEQGLGDEIMFASCLPDLMECCENVILDCDARLAQLFARAFPRAVIHGGSKTDDDSWLSQLAKIDYQIAVGSLPLYFRGSRERFPMRQSYLAADCTRVESRRNWLRARAATLRVGIAWRGGSLRTRKSLRSIDIEQWLPVLRLPGIEFVSLQYGNTTAELEQLRCAHGIVVREPGDGIADIDELAALMSALDLVISVDNTVVHLAGALGQSVWVLLAHAPEWRYLSHGEAMPWYPSVRLYRQPSPRVWGPVLDHIGRALIDVQGTH
jgi:tetratricopeptide (TPR) repeat protein